MSITSKMVRDDLFKGEAWAVKNPEFTERLADALEVLEWLEHADATISSGHDSEGVSAYIAHRSGPAFYGPTPIAAIRAATKGT